MSDAGKKGDVCPLTDLAKPIRPTPEDSFEQKKQETGR